MISIPFSGTSPSFDTADFHTTPLIFPPLVLQREIHVPARISLVIP